MANILKRMDNVRLDCERAAAAVPAGARLLQVEKWCRQPDNNWRLPSLCESVKLPALWQGDRAVWDGEARKPTVQRQIASPAPRVEPPRTPPEIRYERPDYDRQMREIKARAKRERQQRSASLYDIGRPASP